MISLKSIRCLAVIQAMAMLHGLASPALAGCRQDAIAAAKACMTEDLEAGLQGDESAEAKRILGMLAATAEEIKTLKREGDIAKKMAVQSKRGSLLAAIKLKACSKAHEACTSSCKDDQDEPKAREAASACMRIGSKNAKLAEQQAGLMLDNMQTNETVHRGSATMVEHPEGKTGGWSCNDGDSASTCADSAPPQASGSGPGPGSGPGSGPNADQQLAMLTSESIGGNSPGVDFQFDGRFETPNDAAAPSMFAEAGGSKTLETVSRSGSAERNDATGETYAGSSGVRSGGRSLASLETQDGDDDNNGEMASGKKSLTKRALKVIKGLMNMASGGLFSSQGSQQRNDTALTSVTKKSLTKKKDRPQKQAPLGTAGAPPPTMLRQHGVTAANGMSLFEKIHRQYQIQEPSLAAD